MPRPAVNVLSLLFQPCDCAATPQRRPDQAFPFKRSQVSRQHRSMPMNLASPAIETTSSPATADRNVSSYKRVTTHAAIRVLWQTQFSRTSRSVATWHSKSLSRAWTLSMRPRSDPADVSHHLGERAGIDIVEVAEDVDVLWRAAMRSDQSRVVLQRCFVIADADVAWVVELRDINVVFVLVGVDNPIGRKACGAAVGVVTTMFWIPNKCCATVIDRSASTARPPATMTGKWSSSTPLDFRSRRE